MNPRKATADAFALFRVPLEHPVAFALAISPAVVSLVVGCWLFRPTGTLFLSLLIAAFFCLHVVQDYFSGTVTANVSTAVRTSNPLGFWVLWALWVLAYLCAASVPILFAVQGRNEERLSKPAGGGGRQALVVPYSTGGQCMVHHFAP